MKFISTKEASELWGISTSRIVKLAKEGRIPGSSLVGKSWMIPANAQKPADRRTKDNEKRAAERNRDEFIFPLFIYQHYTENNLKTELNEIEQQLYHAQRLQFECKYRESYALLESILRQDINIYIRIGALYTKSYCAVFLKMYTVAKETINELRSIFKEDFPYRDELEIILYNIGSLIDGNNSFSTDFKINSIHLRQGKMRPYLFVLSAYSTALHTLESPASTNPAIHELIGEGLYQDNYLLASQSVNLYTSFIYKFEDNPESSKVCIRKALNIAIQSNMWHTIAVFYKFNANLMDEVLKEYDPEVSRKLTGLNNYIEDCLSGFFMYIHDYELISKLNKNEYILIMYAIQGLSNSEIADNMGISETSVSKKLSVIYQKTDTHNKRELANLYTSMIKNYSHKK